MRNLFRQRAQRDLLRPEPSKKTNNSKKATRPRRLGFRLVSAFMLAAMANEASHYHHPQNPHGNRRERIEEIRQRHAEAEANSRARTLAGSGGGNPHPQPALQTALESGRRRGAGISRAQA